MNLNKFYFHFFLILKIGYEYTVRSFILVPQIQHSNLFFLNDKGEAGSTFCQSLILADLTTVNLWTPLQGCGTTTD